MGLQTLRDIPGPLESLGDGRSWDLLPFIICMHPALGVGKQREGPS